MVDEEGEKFISVKWAFGILITVVLASLVGWSAQRHEAEVELFRRMGAVERVQERLMERLDSNSDMLNRIYLELKEHRTTDK